MPTFGVAATCMDGRIQAAVRKHLRAVYKVDYVDVVAQPGMNGFLAQASRRATPLLWLLLHCLTLTIFGVILRKIHQQLVLRNIRRMIGISVLNHNATILAIVGHAECAGNKSAKEEQIRHLIDARRVVESFGFEISITLLWVCEDWKTVQVIDESSSSISATHLYQVRTAR